jgi:hypothetical protein
MQDNGKVRLNLTLSPVVSEHLRKARFVRNKPFNFLIEQALRMYLAIPKDSKDAKEKR